MGYLDNMFTYFLAKYTNDWDHYFFNRDSLSIVYNSNTPTWRRLKWKLHLMFPCPYPCPSSVPVSVILNYTLLQYCVRFLMIWALFSKIIHYINEKWRHYDVSTIRVRDKKGMNPSHPCTDTGWRTRINGHGQV